MVRLISEVPASERQPVDVMLAALPALDLANLASELKCCMVAVRSGDFWRPCCRLAAPWEDMCEPHATLQYVERAQERRAQIAEQVRVDWERAEARKKATRRAGAAHLVYVPQPHPAAEFREHSRQIGEPHADLCELGRGHIALGGVRHVLDGPPPSEWALVPTYAPPRRNRP